MERQGSPSRYVVGVDGSEDAARALDFTIRLARSSGAEIVAVFALEAKVKLSHAGLYGKRVTLPGPGRGRAAQVGEFVQRWCRPLSESGVSFQTLVEAGDPAEVLAGVAERLDADLVVAGRRGRGLLSDLILGSVSERLAHRCHRPVLLVSRPVAARRAEAGAVALAAGRP